MRFAELKPDLPASIFPQRLQNQEEYYRNVSSKTPTEAIRVNEAWRRSEEVLFATGSHNDDFADDELDDQDLIAAGKLFLQLWKFSSRLSADATTFKNIEEFNPGMVSEQRSHNPGVSIRSGYDIEQNEQRWNPVQLENGKWACNHRCKDKARYECRKM